MGSSHKTPGKAEKPRDQETAGWLAHCLETAPGARVERSRTTLGFAEPKCVRHTSSGNCLCVNPPIARNNKLTRHQFVEKLSEVGGLQKCPRRRASGTDRRKEDVMKYENKKSIIAVAEMLINGMTAAGIAVNEDSFEFEQFSDGPVFTGPSATWYAWSYPGRFQLIKNMFGEEVFTLVLSNELDEEAEEFQWDFFASERTFVVNSIKELDKEMFS